MQERRRELHAATVRAFEALYPERAGERVSWLTLHAFRGEVWDRAAAYMQTDAFPTLDGINRSASLESGALWWIGDHEHAIRLAGRELGALQGVAGWGFGLTVVTNLRVGQAHHSLGAYARAMESLRRNLEMVSGDLLYDRSYMAGLPAVLSRSWLAMCHAEHGEFADALAVGEEAVRIAEVGDPGFSLIVASAGLGSVCLLRGDLDRAVAILERGLVIDAAELTPRAWPFVASTLGAAYTSLGRVGEAIPLLEQAVERAVGMKLRANHALRLVRLAEALVASGRPDNAYPVAAQAFDVAQEHRERGHEAYALRLLGELYAMREPPEHDRAEDHYRKALGLAEQLGMRPLQAHSHLGLGHVLARRGEDGAARASLSAAEELFRACGMTSWMERARSTAAS